MRMQLRTIRKCNNMTQFRWPGLPFGSSTHGQTMFRNAWVQIHWFVGITAGIVLAITGWIMYLQRRSNARHLETQRYRTAHRQG